MLFHTAGRSQHLVLFLYHQDPNMCNDGGPSAARLGRWKAHWATGPGLGGCSQPACTKVEYPADNPLVFDVVADPSEAFPLHGMLNTSASPDAGKQADCARHLQSRCCLHLHIFHACDASSIERKLILAWAGTARLPCNGQDPCNGQAPQGLPSGPGYATPPEISAAVAALVAARKAEVAAFTRGRLVPPPDLPGEGPGRYGVCCDRDPFVAPKPGAANATCDCSGAPSTMV